VVLLKPGWEGNYYGSPEVHGIGCVGRIAEHKLLPDGRYNVALHGEYKATIQSFDRSDPYRIARVERIEEDDSWVEPPGRPSWRTSCSSSSRRPERRAPQAST
jgi:Lon protease-like protein